MITVSLTFNKNNTLQASGENLRETINLFHNEREIVLKQKRFSPITNASLLAVYLKVRRKLKCL
jgi:hypothetical protein